ncbi:Gfo/Idh/MocA family protein [Thalassobacillus pellis]|uniref:Gfo/Idh/MocA family protein n=1 Tax=Thalassobacillus pellis TaxID=748008 RepID=UPI001960D214|nr:Gfo/Idh/MocA family oxidoreductase [Thalassobacillus pellis]MBM7551512.1 putative dehydrogenase [Thalassobacillus pellis]
MLNIALLSKWHVHAEDYAAQAARHPELKIQVVWDEDTERGKAWAEKLGVPFEEDLNTIWKDNGIDGVIVDTPTSVHRDILLEAANHGKHIFTEKVLALTVKECDEIQEAVRKNGIQLMVSLPRLTEPYYLYAQAAVDEGLLGDLTSIRCRMAHNGAVPTATHLNGWLPEHFFNESETGGGALIDLGAHPIYLLNRLAGKANAVTARLNTYYQRGVDDQAVVIVEYQSGALGVIETGFVSSGSPFQLELYGTEGSLLIEEDKVRINSKKTREEGWHYPADLPEAQALPIEQWVDAILNNKEPSIQNEDARQLTWINEAAALSHEKESRITSKQMEGVLNQ